MMTIEQTDIFKYYVCNAGYGCVLHKQHVAYTAQKTQKKKKKTFCKNKRTIIYIYPSIMRPFLPPDVSDQ